MVSQLPDLDIKVFFICDDDWIAHSHSTELEGMNLIIYDRNRGYFKDPYEIPGQENPYGFYRASSTGHDLIAEFFKTIHSIKSDNFVTAPRLTLFSLGGIEEDMLLAFEIIFRLRSLRGVYNHSPVRLLFEDAWINSLPLTYVGTAHLAHLYYLSRSEQMLGSYLHAAFNSPTEKYEWEFNTYNIKKLPSNYQTQWKSEDFVSGAVQVGLPHSSSILSRLRGTQSMSNDTLALLSHEIIRYSLTVALALEIADVDLEIFDSAFPPLSILDREAYGHASDLKLREDIEASASEEFLALKERDANAANALVSRHILYSSWLARLLNDETADQVFKYRVRRSLFGRGLRFGDRFLKDLQNCGDLLFRANFEKENKNL